MRISIIGPAYPLRGGIAHHVYCLNQLLLAAAHDVQVVSFSKLYPGIFFPGTTELDSSRLKLDPGAVSILRPLNPLSWLRAFNTVKAFAPDAIIFQWWQPFFGPVVGVLGRWFRKAGVTCIIECHNVTPHEESPLDATLIRFGLSAADHLIVHSKKDREDLLALIPGKEVSVCPLPQVSELGGPVNSSRSGRTILFFGKVRKYKGLEVLLAAMPRVLEKIECKLVVVGEFYDSIQKYEQLISRHRLENNVRLEDRYVPNEDVAAFFSNADVLVLPYVSASQSGVARIALSSGLPVIASKTGGLSETVIDQFNGLLFPPGDSEALADQIIKYFTGNLGPALSANICEAPPSDSQLCKVIEEIVGLPDKNTD